MLLGPLGGSCRHVGAGAVGLALALRTFEQPLRPCQHDGGSTPTSSTRGTARSTSPDKGRIDPWAGRCRQAARTERGRSLTDVPAQDLLYLFAPNADARGGLRLIGRPSDSYG